ncbi:MAG: AGE family epimerase/isomerase [Bacteroidetes bacterium]|nr:AGE family epimerase/isomerase [Bacteroidota bacterium]
MKPAEYRAEMENELGAILHYWMDRAPDPVNGGFIGRIDGDDQPHSEAQKGQVLNSRILWTFSAAWRHTDQRIYRAVADLAYEYLTDHFLDKEHGGAFWSLDAMGTPLDTRKQIYGQAFTLYGLSEYYLATGERAALDQAIALWELIEKHSFHPRRFGYYEAFARDWSRLDDPRLSEKDQGDPRTMNTHLHVLEAYANLYRACNDPRLRDRIRELLLMFERYIVDPSGHLGLFFDEEWVPRSTLVSFGHDIEAAWLLHEAARVIADRDWIEKTGQLALRLAAAAAEGVDADGGIWYERKEGRLVRQKHWWPQAEAMVGFLQAWQLSDDPVWWQRSVESWKFVKQYIRAASGEWFWGVDGDHSPMPGQDKAGFWKCPYHNGRACMEIMRRLSPI